MYGGTALPGIYRGREVTGLELVEGVGKVSTGELSQAELTELEAAACPAAGSCPIQANREHDGLRLGGDRAGRTGICWTARSVGLSRPVRESQR